MARGVIKKREGDTCEFHEKTPDNPINPPHSHGGQKVRKDILRHFLIFLCLLVFSLSTIYFLHTKPGIEVAIQRAEKELGKAYYPLAYTVERVIDGDTIEVRMGDKLEIVELIGIDAPEEDTKEGQEAKEFVKQLELEGKEVLLEIDVQKRDRFGRQLVYLWKCHDPIDMLGRSVCTFVSQGFKRVCKPDPYARYYEPWYKSNDISIYNNAYNKILKFRAKHCQDQIGSVIQDKMIQFYLINATIVRSGYAQPMTIPPNVKYAELFEELYQEAREQKRGLWSNEDKIVRTRIRKLADKAATERGISLLEFTEPKITFDEERQMWHVLYAEDGAYNSKGELLFQKKHFGIVIDIDEKKITFHGGH